MQQYRRRDSLSNIYELSTRFVDTLVKEMEKMDRYPKGTVLRGKGYVLTDEDAFRDYLDNRTRLLDPTTGPLVEPYIPPEPLRGEDVYVIPENMLQRAMA